MIELKNSIVKFWALRKIDHNGSLIIFPTVDEEQIKRCRQLKEELDEAAVSGRKVIKLNFKNETPKDIA